jgi:signal transduction histidine kinase/DNA-binding response OmpR family regulator
MKCIFRGTLAKLAIWLGICLSTGSHALEAVEYQPGAAINFNSHARTLFSDINTQDAGKVIAEYLEREELWTEPRGRKAASLFAPHYQWRQLTVRNPGNEPLDMYLRHAEANLVKGQFAILRNQQPPQQWQLGTHKPFSERPVVHLTYLIPFTLQPQESVTLLVGHTDVGISRGTQVVEQEQFWIDSSKVAVGDGMYFGTALLICFLVLLMYLGSRQVIYLYCCLIVLGNLMFQVAREGYAYQYLWPNWTTGQSDVVLIAMNLSTVAAILFSMELLKLRTQTGDWLYQISRICLVWNLLLVGMIIVFPADFILNWVIVNILITAVYYFIVWAYSINRSLKGSRRAAFYSVAWLAYFLPNVIATAYPLFWPDQATPMWAMSRNGELLFAITLYIALLLEFRRAQVTSQAGRLEARTKNRFLTAISHELRTPLNGVLGSAELLQTTELNPTQKHYTDIINSSGKTLLNLINDTLDLAKFNEKGLVLEKTPFRLDRMLAECAATFLPEMNKKRLPLYESLDPELPLHYIGDEHRLRQVLFNLLSNAMKFTDSGSIKVTVTGEHAQGTAAKITLRVKDTGIGIPEKSIDKIFEPFSQAEDSTARQYGGSGLGLPICKSIVDQMNGNITATSTPGQGSEFTVQIDLDVDSERETKRLETLNTLQGMRILFLTDAEGAIDALAPNFERWGVGLDAVEDLRTARSRLHSKHYDAVMAFFVLPQVDPLEKLRSLETDTILMHHTNIDIEAANWSHRLIDLPVPAGIQDIANTLIRLKEAQAVNTPEVIPDTPPSDTDNSLTVLVAEDNTTNQMVAVGMLEHLGLKADAADNGQIACEMAQQHHYDLILMDCDMPVMDGYDASRHILALEKKSPIIVALTADAQKANHERCKNAGMKHILHKPISIQELQDYLRESSFIEDAEELTA